MVPETVAIEVPQPLFRRLERLAALTGQPIERLIDSAVSASLPPLPEDLGPSARDELLRLEHLPNDELERVVWSRLPDDISREIVTLRDERAAGQLTPEAEERLVRLTESADLVTQRKAYAAALLRWRGARVPTLDELEARP